MEGPPTRSLPPSPSENAIRGCDALADAPRRASLPRRWISSTPPVDPAQHARARAAPKKETCACGKEAFHRRLVARRRAWTPWRDRWQAQSLRWACSITRRNNHALRKSFRACDLIRKARQPPTPPPGTTTTPAQPPSWLATGFPLGLESGIILMRIGHSKSPFQNRNSFLLSEMNPAQVWAGRGELSPFWDRRRRQGHGAACWIDSFLQRGVSGDRGTASAPTALGSVIAQA